MSSDLLQLQLLETLLFIENRPLSHKEVMSILDISKNELMDLILGLHNKYIHINSSLELVDNMSWVSFKPKEEILEFLKGRYKKLQEKRLTTVMLSVLGIIAYKQPITKVEIDHIRGIDSTYAIKRLMQESFIELAGKKDILGSPNLYKTSHSFLEFFKLKTLNDLPNIEDFQTYFDNS